MKRTLFVRDKDAAVWERAEQAAREMGVSLSLYVTAALRNARIPSDTSEVRAHLVMALALLNGESPQEAK